MTTTTSNPSVSDAAMFDALAPERSRPPRPLTRPERRQLSARQQQLDAEAKTDFQIRQEQSAERARADAERKATEYFPYCISDALIAQIRARVKHPASDLDALKRYADQLRKLRELDLKFCNRNAYAAVETERREAREAIRSGQAPSPIKGRDQLLAEFSGRQIAIAAERRELLADNAALLTRMRQRFVASAAELRDELLEKLPRVRSEFGDDVGEPTLAALRRIPAWVEHYSTPNLGMCPMLGHLLK